MLMFIRTIKVQKSNAENLYAFTAKTRPKRAGEEISIVKIELQVGTKIRKVRKRGLSSVS